LHGLTESFEELYPVLKMEKVLGRLHWQPMGSQDLSRVKEGQL